MSAKLKAESVFSFSSSGARTYMEDHALHVKDRGIYVVADGFGGGKAGMAAAQAGCEAVQDFLEREAGDLDATLPFVLRTYYSLAANVVFNSILYANEKVRALNNEKTGFNRGGASILATFMDGDTLAIANVGACSAWLVRNGKLEPLVTPRVYGKMLDPFLTDVPQDRSIPLSALGMSKDLEPEISEFRVRSGDWLIVQTDGIESFHRQKIAELQKETPAGPLLDSFHRTLQGFSFNDNVSVMISVF